MARIKQYPDLSAKVQGAKLEVATENKLAAASVKYGISKSFIFREALKEYLARYDN